METAQVAFHHTNLIVNIKLVRSRFCKISIPFKHSSRRSSPDSGYSSVQFSRCPLTTSIMGFWRFHISFARNACRSQTPSSQPSIFAAQSSDHRAPKQHTHTNFVPQPHTQFLLNSHSANRSSSWSLERIILLVFRPLFRAYLTQKTKRTSTQMSKRPHQFEPIS